MCIVHIPLEIGYSTQMKSTQKKLNVHAQREKFAFGTQRNLHSTDLRLGFALGVTQILGLASGLRQTLPNVRPQRKGFCVAVEYRLMFLC